MNIFQKKVVLITGASKRLGKTIAIKLAKNGFNVALHYNKSKGDALKLSFELKKKFNIETRIFKADLRNIREIKELINKVYKHYNRLDAVINNAAVFLSSNLTKTTEKIWDDTLDTNLKSVFFLSKYASKKMLANEDGIIINISSLGGLKPFTKSIPYSVSKAGLIMLTKCLAKALAPKIRVNAIAPGTISFNSTNVNAENNLLHSYVKAEEIADLILHLINDYKHLTGQCIAVESGNLLL